jgi:hypothetical protein
MTSLRSFLHFLSFLADLIIGHFVKIRQRCLFFIPLHPDGQDQEQVGHKSIHLTVALMQRNNATKWILQKDSHKTRCFVRLT